MKQVLLGLVIADMLVLAGAMMLGWMGVGARMFALHFALGLFGTIYTALMHSIVYVYFIVSGKVVGEAVERGGFDPDWAAQAKRLKMKTFRYAFLAILAVIATALVGGFITTAASGSAAVDSSAGESAARWHLTLAIVSLLVQPAVAVVEYRNIGRQQQLTASVLSALEEWRRSNKRQTSTSS